MKKQSRWALAFLMAASAVGVVGCSDPVSPIGSEDAGGSDTGGSDTGGSDTGPSDTGARDTGGTDTGPADVGTDSGPADAGPADAGPADVGTDTGPADAGPLDAGAGDAGAGDAGSVDATTGDATTGDAGLMCPVLQGTGITVPGMVANITAMTTGGSNRNASTTCQANAGGPDHAYNVTVSRRARVVFSTANTGTTFDTVLALRRNCTDRATEFSCNDDGDGTRSVISNVLDPGSYTLLVDGYSSGSGTYVLSTTSYDLAANAECAMPTPLTAGMGLSNQQLGGAGAASTACLTSSNGGQLFYSLTIPANSLATIRVTPGMTPAFTPVIRLLDACNATACLASTTGTSGTVTSLTFANNGTAPRTVLVSVASTTPSVGTFSIDATTTTLMPGQSCEMPIPLMPGQSIMGVDTSMGAPASAACAVAATATPRYYSVTVPQGQRVVVSATSTGSTARAATLRVIDGCTNSQCLDSYTSPSTTTPGQVILSNGGTAPRTFVVLASGTSSTTAGTFTLSASAAAASAPGEVCAAPIDLAAGATLMNQDTATAIARPPTSCSATEGNVRHYRVIVPPGRQIVVRATPSAGLNVRIRHTLTCTTTSCESSAASSSSAAVSLTALTNPTTSPRDAIISVGSTSTTNGTYTLESIDTAITGFMPRYTVTQVPTACDDLAMGTSLAPSAGWSDDSVTAITALPTDFAFSLVGDRQTHYAVSSNGFVHLFPNAMGSPLSTFSNQLMPSATTPNGVVAPLWDDLVPNMGTVRSAVLGTAPNRRFVVGWNNWGLIGESGVVLTFQAKLFETTNVVEFHYCSAMGTTTPRSRGASASIGVENNAGTAGVLVQYERDNAYSTAQGYRLTPAN